MQTKDVFCVIVTLNMPDNMINNLFCYIVRGLIFVLSVSNSCSSTNLSLVLPNSDGASENQIEFFSYYHVI